MTFSHWTEFDVVGPRFGIALFGTATLGTNDISNRTTSLVSGRGVHCSSGIKFSLRSAPYGAFAIPFMTRNVFA